MSRRQRLDWAICTVVLMLAYAGRGWLLATLLQGHYPWKALLVDVTALALLVSTFRLFDLGLRAFCQCMVTRWRTPRTLEQTDAKPPLLLSTNWQRAANSAVGTKGRVALGITPQGSHRSVLAQLRHTARQGRDSLRTVIATRSAKVKALAAGTR